MSSLAEITAVLGDAVEESFEKGPDGNVDTWVRVKTSAWRDAASDDNGFSLALGFG